jgi:hypothetical protein
MDTSTTDKITYLNGTGEEPPFYSKLVQLLKESKQARAPAKQWLATIEAFKQKGVKALELDDTAIRSYLEMRGDAQITKEALVEHLESRTFTIKEVVLSTPKYGGWHQKGGQYAEFLYIANSERDNMVDLIEEIEYRMEQFNFSPELLADDPAAVIDLERRREELMTRKSDAYDFPHHHYSNVVNGRLGRNLMAHCRVTVRGDTYFIEEIQSDWAQRGRSANWQGIARGPLVTSTEAWAGMVLRRHLQLAAQNPAIKQVAWITESMRNGGQQNLEGERTKELQRNAFNDYVTRRTGELRAIRITEATPADQVEQISAAITAEARDEAQRVGLRMPGDLLNDFYLKVVPKLADKALGKSGMKTSIIKIDMGEAGAVVEVPGFAMTDKAREVLSASQVVYSRAPLRLVRDQTEHHLDAVTRAAIQRGLLNAHEMLGSTRHVVFANAVYDIASGRQVAGKYNNRILVSLNAADVAGAVTHEIYHFAHDRLLNQREREMVRHEFGRDTLLNYRVREALGLQTAAAKQCLESPEEAAAHGFQMWHEGRLSLFEKPVSTLFNDLLETIRMCMQWIQRVVFEHRVTNSEELFEALARGQLREEAEDLQSPHAFPANH